LDKSVVSSKHLYQLAASKVKDCDRGSLPNMIEASMWTGEGLFRC